jgi:hypothetical protein
MMAKAHIAFGKVSKKGDCFIGVTTWAGLTVLAYLQESLNCK